MMGSDTFTFRRVSSMGCEILGRDGICAWTVDWSLAARIVSLLNREADESDNRTDAAADHAAGDEATARRAIEYLANHDPVIYCTFPPHDPPSEAVREMVEPRLQVAAKEIGELLARYVMCRLADDFLRLGGIAVTPTP